MPVLPPPTPIKPDAGGLSLEPDGGNPPGRVGYVTAEPPPGTCSITGMGEPMHWNAEKERYERSEGDALYTIQFFGDGTYTLTVSVPPGPPIYEHGVWKYAG